MRTSELFVVKIFENYGASTRTKGERSWSSANILQTMGRDPFFAILCERFLWTTPKLFCDEFWFWKSCL